MKELAIYLKFMSLYTHNAHNLCEKALFFQDHAFLGGLYDTYETAYDGVVERIIGLSNNNAINLVEVNTAAANLLQQHPAKENENINYFIKLEQCEQKLRSMITQIYPQTSIGTQQMIGNLADQSEARSYQLKSRTKK